MRGDKEVNRRVLRGCRQRPHFSRKERARNGASNRDSFDFAQDRPSRGEDRLLRMIAR
jgi:hypothetical protein